MLLKRDFMFNFGKLVVRKLQQIAVAYSVEKNKL